MSKIKNSSDLYDFLSDKFKSRFEGDPLVAMTGAVQGKLDGRLFNLTYLGDNYMLLSAVGEDGRILVDNLMDVLNEVMGCGPIISYDMNHAGKGQNLVKPTVEWDVVDPEGRIKEIVNGRAFPDKPEITNIKLYGSKLVDDYLETKEEIEERIKNTRIYGKDTGSIQDVEAVNNLSEVELFFQINALGGHIWRCKHEMAHGRIEHVDLTEEQYALEYMVYLTTKFGVEIPEPEMDKHVEGTESYRAWFKFYNDHFNGMSESEWESFVRVRQNGGDVTPYMPTGSWKDLLEKGPKKELK